MPEQLWGDYLAALSAVRIGERDLLALGAEVGWDTLARHAEDWLDYSEQRMIQAIRRLPSGRAVVQACHDPFPGVPDGIWLASRPPAGVARSRAPARQLRRPPRRNSPDALMA